MQFVENNMMGLRAVHVVMRGPDGLPDISLLPMIHIGTKAFYTEVQKRLADCDVVLFEGVNSFRVRLLTLTYILVARRKRLGLVTQQSAINMATLCATKIHADANREQFNFSWNQIPWQHRIALFFLAPLLGVHGYLTASRATIARRLSTEEVETHRDTSRADAFPEVDSAIRSTRDARLVDKLKETLMHKPPYGRIGIIYGAAHMRVISRLLTGEFGYRVMSAEWVTVFDHD